MAGVKVKGRFDISGRDQIRMQEVIVKAKIFIMINNKEAARQSPKEARAVIMPTSQALRLKMIEDALSAKAPKSTAS
jgi:hypothetical protein